MARKGGKDRGLFERPKGSGIWWVRYFDEVGRERREKVGPKALARKRYMQRKTEIAEGRYFPDARRRDVVLDELVSDYREATGRKGKAIMRTDIGYRRLLERFGGRRADSDYAGRGRGVAERAYGKHERGDCEPSPTTIARGPAPRRRQSHATAR